VWLGNKRQIKGSTHTNPNRSLLRSSFIFLALYFRRNVLDTVSVRMISRRLASLQCVLTTSDEVTELVGDLRLVSRVALDCHQWRVSDELSIANNFAAMFQSACMPNSPARHDSLKAKFQAQFDGYRDELSITFCSVEMVDSCIRQLKRGKAAGHEAHDQLTV